MVSKKRTQFIQQRVLIVDVFCSLYTSKSSRTYDYTKKNKLFIIDLIIDSYYHLRIEKKHVFIQ